MMMSKRGVAELQARLADHTLGMQALRVLMVMIEMAGYENIVEISQKDLGARLGMSSGELSKASLKLLQCGFIERRANRRGWYRISPKLLWIGSVKNLDAELRGRAA